MNSPSIKSPYGSVSIGGHKFYYGDGHLKSIEVTQAEGSNSSNCRFSIYDPGRKYTDKFFEYIEEVGGLEPLDTPDTGSPASSTGSAGNTANGTLSPNMRAMLDTIAWAEGANYDTLFGGGTFSSYADHPRRTIRASGFASTAAGRYQFLSSTWDEVAGQEGLKDFTPQSQDIGAVNRVKSRGAFSAVEAGNVAAALDSLSYEWASLPPYRYSGQGTKTLSQVETYFKQRVAQYAPAAQSQAAAVESVQQMSGGEKAKDSKGRAAALAGSQITVELGFDGQLIAAHSFLHTSLDFLAYDTDTLDFGGQAAVWVLTQRVKNSAYQNITLKELWQKVCANYGLTLDMTEDGPKYEYFPQRGVTDYQMLLIECRRIGYRVINRGNVVSVGPRKFKNSFVLRPGENLGLEFSVSHQAQGNSDGGARSSDPSQRSTTGQRKVIIDPATGELTQIHPENTTGADGSEETDSPEVFTTGSTVPPAKPLTDEATDAKDLAQQRNEKRVKGIMATWSAPTTPALLLVDPDTTVVTEGLSPILDRVWVCESVTHKLTEEGGYNTSGTLYSPLVNKYPTPEPAAQSLSSDMPGLPPLNPGGFIKPTSGVLTSPFGQRGGRLHKGVDIAARQGAPIWASADGVVQSVVDGCTVGNRRCGGGFGNWVAIAHSGGFVTRYAHMTNGSVKVSAGQSIKQGEEIGTQDNTGDSRGVHLHFEILRNGTPENPQQHIKV